MSDQLMYQCRDCKEVMVENELLRIQFPELKIGNRTIAAREGLKCRHCRGRVVLLDEKKLS
jgi:DNA-directed RNA polymerase subunit RPC12/RpoP